MASPGAAIREGIYVILPTAGGTFVNLDLKLQFIFMKSSKWNKPVLPNNFIQKNPLIRGDGSMLIKEPDQKEYVVNAFDMFYRSLHLSDTQIEQYHRAIKQKVNIVTSLAYRPKNSDVEYKFLHPYPKYQLDYDNVSSIMSEYKLNLKYAAKHHVSHLEAFDKERNLRKAVHDNVEFIDNYTFISIESPYTDLCKMEAYPIEGRRHYALDIYHYREFGYYNPYTVDTTMLSRVCFAILFLNKMRQATNNRNFIDGIYYVVSISFANCFRYPKDGNKEMAVLNPDQRYKKYTINRIVLHDVKVQVPDGVEKLKSSYINMDLYIVDIKDIDAFFRLAKLKCMYSESGITMDRVLIFIEGARHFAVYFDGLGIN